MHYNMGRALPHGKKIGQLNIETNFEKHTFSSCNLNHQQGAGPIKWVGRKNLIQLQNKSR